MALTYPWFLFGLFSLAVPIILHLFELRRPQRVLFTNVGFIREVKLVTARQRRLKHRLVLLSRLGFLFFLVLMFCQPFIPAPQQSVGAASAVRVLVDTSPSMAAVSSNDQPLLDEAGQQARDLPTAYPANTRFLLGQQPAALTPAAFRTAVDQLAITARTQPLLPSTSQPASEAEQLFIFSDFQKSQFSRHTIASLDSTHPTFLVPLAGQANPNVFVDSVALDDAFVRLNTDLTLRIRLRNGGSKDAADCQARLYIGERQAAAFRATVPAGQTVTTAVRVRLTDNQPQRCRVVLDDAPVTFDNTYYFVLQAAPRIRLLDLVTEDAPATQQLYRNEPLFSYSRHRAPTAQLRAAGRRQRRAAAGAAASGSGAARQPAPGGAAGGFAGDCAAGQSPSARESYSRLFQALGLGGVQWEPAGNGVPPRRDVQLPDPRNPFFQDVFAGQTRQVGLPKAAPVLRWSRSDNDTAAAERRGRLPGPVCQRPGQGLPVRGAV